MQGGTRPGGHSERMSRSGWAAGLPRDSKMRVEGVAGVECAGCLLTRASSSPAVRVRSKQRSPPLEPAPAAGPLQGQNPVLPAHGKRSL